MQKNANKTRRIAAGVVAVILVLAMVVPMIIGLIR